MKCWLCAGTGRYGHHGCPQCEGTGIDDERDGEGGEPDYDAVTLSELCERALKTKEGK